MQKTIKAKIVRISESGNSAMVAVSTNSRNMGNTLAYTKLLPEEKGVVKVGEELELETGFSLVEKFNSDGELMTYKDGTPILFVQY